MPDIIVMWGQEGTGRRDFLSMRLTTEQHQEYKSNFAYHEYLLWECNAQMCAQRNCAYGRHIVREVHRGSFDEQLFRVLYRIESNNPRKVPVIDLREFTPLAGVKRGP